MFRVIWTLFALAILTLAGCTTFRGAPSEPFSVKEVWSQAQIRTAVHSLSGNCPVGDKGPPSTCTPASKDKERNAAAFLLLALVDTGYMEFTHKFVYDTQHIQASTNFLRLLMTVAGGLTQSTGVKDNYLAGASLLAGGDAIVDSEYLFKGTAQALVARMDATRARMRTDIDKKLRLPYSDYPGSSALADIQAYYRAGTIAQAVSDAQKDAAAVQTAEEKIQRDAVDALLIKRNR